LGKVATFYELRWLIEEFFHLLQSAYRIEGSHLTDAAKIARRLVLLTLAATSVLPIKSTLGLPAKGPLPAADYERVKIAITQPDNPNLDPNLCFFALLANLGGWLARRNDPIGPTLLMRGLLKVLAIADALQRFGPTLDNLLASLPQLLASIIRV
jgi:hypothetical protein